MANNVGSLPIIPATRGDDIHNIDHMHDADLVLFMAGNQFMVMEELLGEFRQDNPDIKRIFYETLPPGLELKQILAGGALFGEKLIDVMPDIYTSVTEDAVNKLRERDLEDRSFVYLHNRIVLMIPEGNPMGISAVNDLGRDDITISQPGELEDISLYIHEMYKEAGGEALLRRIMDEKRAEGTTILTVVHHRETPLRLVKGTADTGPVWATEVINARNEGVKVEMLDPGEGLDQRDKVNYFITKLKGSGNPENADRFLDFITSEKARNIYSSYGFVPHGQ